ncbi:MAG: 2-oxoacid:acceptor oxidoreductase family protein [Candidatus Margulisiibacteriota bacterium]
MQSHDFRFELLMDAGNGAQKAGDILIMAFAKTGRFVFIEPMIPAEISPPKRTPHSMSGVVIRVSDRDVTNLGSYSDLMLVEHEILLDRRLQDQEYKPNATVLLDMGDQKRSADLYEQAIGKAKAAGLNVIPFHMDEESTKIMWELNGNGKNMFYLGLLTHLFDTPVEDVLASIQKTFKKLSPEKLEKNTTIFKNGHAYAKANIPLVYSVPSAPSTGAQKLLMDGNTALAMGVVDAGIKFYGGYPITPASSIMHTLAKIFPNYGGILHQAEDEISAIGAVVGSYYAGVPSITATSGPGLSLKQEFIGLATSAEIPCIVVDVQRGGPSTGLPTRTEQSDYFAAAFGSHGDNTKVVLSVGDVVDCFYAPHVARYLTEKLRVPVIILSDYMTSVSYKIFDKIALNPMEDPNDIHDDVLARFNLKRLPDVEMVVENQSIPGDEGQMRRVTGLNTDKNGQIMYTTQSNIRSHTVRNEKLNHVRRCLTTPEMFGPDSGDTLIIGWGSSRSVIEESVLGLQAEGLKVSGLHLKIVYPLPIMLKEIFAKFKTVICFEVAYSDEFKPGPLATVLRAETLVDVKSVAIPTGRPLKPAHVIAQAKELTHAN